MDGSTRDHIAAAAPSRRHLGLLGQLAVLGLGMMSSVQVMNFNVTALSVVCVLLVPAFLLMRHRPSELLPLLLAVLGWISFLASCVLNDVSVLWPNALAPASFSLYLLGFTVITNRSVDRIAALLTGIAVGTTVFFVTQGIELTEGSGFLHLWKYGIAHSATLIILFAAVMVRASVPLTAWLLAALGLISLGLNFRSHALVCLAVAVLLLVQHHLGNRIRKAWIFGGVILFGVLFYFLMPVAARIGMFGPVLQQKTFEQDDTGVPLYLAGRTEPPMSITAILERPFSGWGSALNLPPDTYTRAEHLGLDMGYAPSFPFELYWRLPATDYSAIHSILLGSWVEGGFIALLLPLWLLFACFALIWRNQRFGKWTPIVLVLALQGIWDLLYAPWTYNMIAEFACLALFFAVPAKQPNRAP